MRNINYISPINLNGTVRLFKDLGRSDEAKAMIKEYLAKRSEGSGFYDLTRYPFGGEIGDEDVRGAFAAKLASFAQKTVASPDLFLKLKDGEWDPGALDAIAALPVEDYYQIIVNAEGPDLRRIISGCLQFNRISNATDSMRLIASKATAALKKIAATSDINRRRVASLGIALPGPEDQKPADAPVEPG